MKNQVTHFLVPSFLCLFSFVANAADKVVLSGNIQSLSCTAACGVCCPTHSIVDSSGLINLPIGNSFVDLSNVSDDGKIHQLSGYFYETAGQCGINQCTLFAAEDLDTEKVNSANYDSNTQSLSIQSVVVDNDKTQTYSLVLTAPFTVDSATQQSESTLISQGGDCSVEGSLCSAGTICVAYFGIAGPQGPEFKSCEIPCFHPGASCPLDQSCVTISDGPGQVCRVD